MRVWDMQNNKRLIWAAAGTGAIIIAMIALFLETREMSPEAVSKALDEVKIEAAKGLPTEGRSRTFVNADQVNKDKKYIAALYETETDKDVEVHTSRFILQAYQEHFKHPTDKLSMVMVGIVAKNKKDRQYTIRLGRDVAEEKNRQNPQFWAKASKEDLFAWLSEVCPKTPVNDLAKHCYISQSLDPLYRNISIPEETKAPALKKVNEKSSSIKR